MADSLALDIAAIAATAGKMQPEIQRLMMSDIRRTLSWLYKEPGNIQSKKDLLTFKAGSIMQPYDVNLTEAHEMGVLSKRELQVQVGMAYVRDEVEKYRDTYLATLDDLNVPMSKYPINQWYVETISLVGLNDMAKLPWQGEKSTDKTVIAIADGYLKIIDDEITATNISTSNGNLYTLSGAASDYTSSTIGDELKAQWALLSAELREKGGVIHIPYRYKDMYREWYKSEYPNATEKEISEALVSLEGTDGLAKFHWDSNMGTTKRVVMTSTTNLVYGVDAANKEFGKLTAFHPNGNPLLLGSINKVVIGFQIRTLDSSEFNVNKWA